mmetsp:Transcript_66390/g.167339  ORF Transcript_66390/g.167339 Transcript_66390/m.167339 type:complete len:378 (-) Transcript_66390:1192-2325(-)
MFPPTLVRADDCGVAVRPAGRRVEAEIGVMVLPYMEALPIVLAHDQRVRPSAVFDLFHLDRLCPCSPCADDVVAFQRLQDVFRNWGGGPPSDILGSPLPLLVRMLVSPEHHLAIGACIPEGENTGELIVGSRLDCLGEMEHPLAGAVIVRERRAIHQLMQVYRRPVQHYLEQVGTPGDAGEAAHGAEAAKGRLGCPNRYSLGVSWWNRDELPYETELDHVHQAGAAGVRLDRIVQFEALLGHGLGPSCAILKGCSAGRCQTRTHALGIQTGANNHGAVRVRGSVHVGLGQERKRSLLFYLDTVVSLRKQRDNTLALGESIRRFIPHPRTRGLCYHPSGTLQDCLEGIRNPLNGACEGPGATPVFPQVVAAGVECHQA